MSPTTRSKSNLKSLSHRESHEMISSYVDERRIRKLIREFKKGIKLYETNPRVQSTEKFEEFQEFHALFEKNYHVLQYNSSLVEAFDNVQIQVCGWYDLEMFRQRTDPVRFEFLTAFLRDTEKFSHLFPPLFWEALGKMSSKILNECDDADTYRMHKAITRFWTARGCAMDQLPYYSVRE